MYKCKVTLLSGFIDQCLCCKRIRYHLFSQLDLHIFFKKSLHKNKHTKIYILFICLCFSENERLKVTYRIVSNLGYITQFRTYVVKVDSVGSILGSKLICVQPKFLVT